MSVCPCSAVCVYLSIYPYLTASPPFCRSMPLSVSLYLCLLVYLSIRLYIFLFFSHQFINDSLFLFIFYFLFFKFQVAPMILVLSPTRELAQQIAHEAEALSTYHNFHTVVLVGKFNELQLFCQFVCLFVCLCACLSVSV